MTAAKKKPAAKKAARKPAARKPAAAKAPAASKPAATVPDDEGVTATMEALRQSEPTTLVGGAELAGAALANNEVAVMEEGATHPGHDE